MQEPVTRLLSNNSMKYGLMGLHSARIDMGTFALPDGLKITKKTAFIVAPVCTE